MLSFWAHLPLFYAFFLTVMINVFTPEMVTDLQTATQGTIASHFFNGKWKH